MVNEVHRVNVEVINAKPYACLVFPRLHIAKMLVNSSILVTS